MPEGHLIHHFARQHAAALDGRRVHVSSPQGRFVDADALDGCEIERVEAWGKHLFYAFAQETIVHVHLGQRGLFVHAVPPAPAARPQVRMRIEGPTLVVDLIAPRTCERIRLGDRERIIAALGPDPLRPGADPRRAREAIARSSRPIGALLLDPSIIAGVGNVLRAEALSIARLDPTLPGRALSRDEFDALWTVLGDMMALAAERGRIITRAPLPEGMTPESVPEAEARYVYKQAHCRRCNTPVHRAQVGGRTLYSCPFCQRR